MKVAISVSNGFVAGPGEGEEVWIVEVNSDGSYRVLERYENPALYAQQVRGVFMLRSVLERGVNAVLLSEIGPPGFRWAVERGLNIYIFEGRVEDAIRAFAKGELKRAEAPTHGEHHHGHHHHHREEAGDYEFLKPFVNQGMVIADLGCGPGYYCQFFKDYASKLYCVDADEEALEEVRKNIKGENLVVLNEDIARTSIPSGAVDLVFMSNVFHDIEDKEAVVREICRILKDGGRLIIVEFKPHVLFGPPFKLSPDEVREYFRNGFNEEQYLDVSPYHYSIVFKKVS